MFASRVETGSPEGWGRVRNGAGRDTLYCLLLLKELKYCLLTTRQKLIDLEEKDKLGQPESVAGECQWGHEKKAVHDDRRLKVMMKREALMDSRARE